MAFRFFILFVCVVFINAEEIIDDDDFDDDDFESRSPAQSNFNTTTIPFNNNPFGKPAAFKPFDISDSTFSDKPKDSSIDPFIVSSISTSTYDPFFKATITSSLSSINESLQISSSSSTYMFGKPIQFSTSSSNTNYLFDNISPTSSSTYSFEATNKPMENLPFNKNKIEPFGNFDQDEKLFTSSESMNSGSIIYSVTPSLKMKTASISIDKFPEIGLYPKITDSSRIISTTSTSFSGQGFTNAPLNFPAGDSSLISQSVTYPNMFNPFDNNSSSKSSISPTASSSIFPYKTASFRR